MKKSITSLLALIVAGGLYFNYFYTNSPSEVQGLGFRWFPASERQVQGHIAQKDIESGLWTLEQLRIAGWRLFSAQFTYNEGAGRPGATGNQEPTRRPLGTGESFVRTAGPDSNSCASCHNRPTIGGAGDFATNVFVGLGSRHPTFKSIDPEFAAERDTPDMHGAGVIELLAREMTHDLHEVRKNAIMDARRSNAPRTVDLITKSVNFGKITALPNGEVNLRHIKGVDRDLVVRPWGQKGAVTSLRTFTVSAANLHHGIQANERFGLALTGSRDFDRDGYTKELTEGDITALTLFQATLNIPGQYLPASVPAQEVVKRGKEHFEASECDSCHRSEMILEDPTYCEPGPYNLEGTLRSIEIVEPYCVNLATQIPGPALEKKSDGKYIVRLFSDLRRHVISDSVRPHFANEVLVEGLIPTDEFITKRLWAVGSTSPYGHRGDLTLISEAIENHGGGANSSREKFDSLKPNEKKALLKYLYSLQILPEGSSRVSIRPNVARLPYSHD